MILVLVGTTPFGWDGLVQAADLAAGDLGLVGTAQIGNGATTPRTLTWLRFLPHAELLEQVTAADLVVTHGGVGSLGDGVRHARRLVVVPRRRGVGSRGRQIAPNDQWPVARRLGQLYGFDCVELDDLTGAVARALSRAPREHARPSSDAADLLSRWAHTEGLAL